MENYLKGSENYFELTGGSCCRGFELPGVVYIVKYLWEKILFTDGDTYKD